MQGTHLDRSKGTVGVIAVIVFTLIVVKCSCNQVGLAESDAEVSLSLTTLGPVEPASERGAGRARPFIIRRMRVTAYCPCDECCWPHADGITASGHAINPGDLLCAADPSIPFGTRIFIPGYSAFPVRVKDRGADIVGDRLDVLFYDGNLKTSHPKAIEWGVRILDCKLYIGD